MSDCAAACAIAAGVRCCTSASADVQQFQPAHHGRRHARVPALQRRRPWGAMLHAWPWRKRRAPDVVRCVRARHVEVTPLASSTIVGAHPEGAGRVDHLFWRVDRVFVCVTLWGKDLASSVPDLARPRIFTPEAAQLQTVTDSYRFKIGDRSFEVLFSIAK